MTLVARPLDPVTKKPVGPVREVYRFPLAFPYNTGQVGLWFGDNRLVFALQGMRGNIWMGEPQAVP